MLRQKISSETDLIEIHQDPKLAAKVAGLKYVTDVSAGFTRKKRGAGFVYLDTAGKRIVSEENLQRIRSLAIPPAWSEVWICPYENGHLQATGRDDRGRKQYRYHADWNRFRNETKFSRMKVFASQLPRIRNRIEKDLSKQGIGREKVLACVVKIMEQTMIRVGNDEYAEQNDSFGLTTLRNSHAKVQGGKARFRFNGKSGKFHDVEIEDKRLAQIIRKCQDLPGQELFEYELEDGSTADVTSNDVNEYLREITGENITAKDFRTWGGTVQAALSLLQVGPCQTKKDLKKSIAEAVENTSNRLRNTPTVCRKYYIHPCVFEAFETGNLFQIHANCSKNAKLKKSPIKNLFPEEYFAFKILEKAEKSGSENLKESLQKKIAKK